MSINLHFTERDWDRIERDWTSWWAGELNRPLVIIENPTSRLTLPMEMTHEFLFEKPIDEVVDHHQMLLETREFYGDAYPKWWPNFGPGIMAGFLGARVNCDPEMTTVWFEPNEEPAIEKLKLRYNTDNPWWKRVCDLTQRAVERWENKVCVAHTDLGGNLDIIASFRTTQQLIYDLFDAPGEVLRLCGETTRAWIRYYDELDAIIRKAGRGTTPWAPIWSPKRCYMLQSDFSYMISPEMFQKFVMPDLEACCSDLEHPFYHLDGHGQIRHLDALLSIEKLAGIQWIPGDGQPPEEEWIELLKRIRDGGKLCQLFVTAEGARTIVKELGGRGFVFYIMSFISSREEADDFLRVLAADDSSR